MKNFTERMKKRYLKKINKAYRKYHDYCIEAETQRKIFTLYVDTYEKLLDENVMENECFKDIRDPKCIEELNSTED